MGRLLEAIKNQDKALRRLDKIYSKWSWPLGARYFPSPARNLQMPGDDAFGRRPNAIQHPKT